MAPTLTTDRLRLAGHRIADLADCAAMWGDAQVVRHIGGRPFTPEEVWHRLQRYAGHWALAGYGFWAVRDLHDDRFLGEVGFADFRRPLDPPIGSPVEAGWAFAPAAQGRGIAHEALATALAWLDASPHAGRVTALIDPDNAPSIRLATRHGFHDPQPVSNHGHDALLFTRLAADGASPSNPRPRHAELLSASIARREPQRR